MRVATLRPAPLVYNATSSAIHRQTVPMPWPRNGVQDEFLEANEATSSDRRDHGGICCTPGKLTFKPILSHGGWWICPTSVIFASVSYFLHNSRRHKVNYPIEEPRPFSTSYKSHKLGRAGLSYTRLPFILTKTRLHGSTPPFPQGRMIRPSFIRIIFALLLMVGRWKPLFMVANNLVDWFDLTDRRRSLVDLTAVGCCWLVGRSTVAAS